MVFSLALSESRGLGTFFGFSVRVAGWCSPAEVSYFSSFTSPVFFELPGRVDALDDELEDEALDDDELAEDELPCPRSAGLTAGAHPTTTAADPAPSTPKAARREIWWGKRVGMFALSSVLSRDAVTSEVPGLSTSFCPKLRSQGRKISLNFPVCCSIPETLRRLYLRALLNPGFLDTSSSFRYLFALYVDSLERRCGTA